jgi:cyclopropane fatty-acyl-phospholipid synthase-like methyltransferase
MSHAASVPIGHPDRLRWNSRYAGSPSLITRGLAERALSLPLPEGPVLDLACGVSASTLLAAEMGRRVTAVDVSDVALNLLAAEVNRRGLDELVTVVWADLANWRPPSTYAAVLCMGYWDRALFTTAVDAVRPGGAVAWEAFTMNARQDRPHLPPEWCLNPGEPASLLPSTFTVLENQPHGPSKHQLLATTAG